MIRCRGYHRKTDSYLARFLLLLLIPACPGLGCSSYNEGEHALRIGWQRNIAVHAQVMLEMQKIASQGGLRGKYEFYSFDAGPAAIEAAAAGKLDVVFAGSRPTVSLITRARNWVVAGSDMSSALELLVPQFSSVRSIHDLVGRTVGLPQRTVAEEFLAKLMSEANLAEDSIQVRHFALEELPIAAVSGSGRDEVAAYIVWDPFASILATRGFRVVYQTNTPIFYSVSRDVCAGGRGKVIDFSADLQSAWAGYRNHRIERDLEASILTRMAGHEAIMSRIVEAIPNSNRKTASEVIVFLSDEKLKLIQDSSNVLFQKQRLTRSIDPKIDFCNW